MKTVTGLSDRDAVEFLSKCGWMVDRAADLYLEAARKGYVPLPLGVDLRSSTAVCPSPHPYAQFTVRRGLCRLRLTRRLPSTKVRAT